MGFLFIYILGPGLAGGLMLLAGQYLRRRDQRINAWQVSQVRLLLTEWHVVVAREKEAQVVNALFGCLTTLMASILLATGTIMLVFSGVTICLALSLFGTLLINLSPRIQPFVECLYAILVLGSGAGLLLALQRIRRKSLQSIRYGDLRQRHVADYRSLFIQGLPLLCFLLVVIETLLFVPYQKAYTHLEFMTAVFLVPQWVIWSVPALMVLAMKLVEMCIARVVRFPRLLVPLDPQIARGFDDMLRANFVGWLLCTEFLAFGSLIWAQYGLLNMNISLLLAGIPVYLDMIMVLSYFCGLLMIFAGILVAARRGRLGGKILQQPRQGTLESV